ncbi:MAG: hypothetical protein JWN37_604 [Candidatus Nomurabacteria bacterium]|nr:hypothetical protein [Candidatus Nomurabacteria bacterium]
MEFQYPTTLIERIVRYFKEKYQQDISHDTAIEYLDSLADLHGSFIEFLQTDDNKKEELPNSLREGV